MTITADQQARNTLAHLRSLGVNCGSGTKTAEYTRTIELFEEIHKSKGLYFALALLYDSQYTNADLCGMMEVLKPEKGKLSDMMKNC